MDTGPDHLGEFTDPAQRTAPTYPIGSVDNALRILLLLRDRGTLTLSEVAGELGIVRSSAHRLMAMLTYYDFVRQSPVDRSFRTGPALVDIGLTAARGLDLRALARPILAELTQSTGMTAHLVLPRGRNVLFADGVESSRTIRAALRTGSTLPAHVTGAGKALLALLPDQRLRRLYAHEPPEALTEKSVSSITALLSEIARVRRIGYAINRGESETGVLAMGVACAGPDAHLLAGLSLSGPDFAMSEDWEGQVSRQLSMAAAELSKHIQAHSF
ncbi:IclR family transcriptional regulator [Streptomyces sp. NPDC013178]|uniref:IclR family transcriptional regulator n=1 Tax=Streptomyces sp. NPDC013178 TaxID=3155118 RepID=UPI0033F5A9A5